MKNMIACDKNRSRQPEVSTNSGAPDRETTSFHPKPVPASSARTVLLVEDETSVAQTGRQLLERLSWQVRIAVCGQEALACLKEKGTPVFVVLMDMNLPDMEGDRLFAKMRKIRPGLKVVLCSGYGKDDKIHQLVADGARGFCKSLSG